jgi:hypothetical protein
MRRASLSLSLILSLLAVPLIMDHCASACETNRASGAGAPACHHDTAPSAVVGGAVERCGHDHASAVAVGAADPLRLLRSSSWTVVAVVSTTPAAPTVPPLPRASDCSPPPASHPADAISPLRI